MTSTHTILRSIVLAAAALACSVTATPALAGGFSWFGGEHVQGNGKIVHQTRELGHFTALATSVGGNIEVRIGNTESVSIETDDNLMPLVETVIENGTLRIRPAKRDMQLDTRTMKIVVQAKAVDHISVAGSGSVEAAHLSGDKLLFDVGGSGSIALSDLHSAAVNVSLGGSGNLQASGSAEHLHVSIGGSGRVQTGQLETRDAVVNIGGSGQATVWVRQTLNVSVAGSGDIGYYGDPQVTKNVMGSGSVKRLGGAPQ